MSGDASDEDKKKPLPQKQDATNGKRTADEALGKTEAEEPKRVGPTETLDLAETLGYKAGDKFEVQWEIEKNGSKETSVHWWPATLLEHDGRTVDSVAIRVLDYEPMLELGFPRAQEDVVFLGKETIANPETSEQLTYRRVKTEQGDDDDDDTIYLNRSNVEQVVNETLDGALKKNSAAFTRLPAAQKAAIASAVADKKSKLVDLLLSHPSKVVTSSDMQAILSKIMADEQE